MSEAKVEMNSKLRPNHLGVLGWAYGGRYGLERYAYILHRISGLAILLYLLLHIYVNGFRLNGEDGWKGIMERFDNPLFKLGEFALFCAVAYHALNGLRLIIGELGLLLGKPHQPTYPYVSAQQRQRPLFWILMIFTFIVLVCGGADLLLGWTK